MPNTDFEVKDSVRNSLRELNKFFEWAKHNIPGFKKMSFIEILITMQDMITKEQEKKKQ